MATSQRLIRSRLGPALVCLALVAAVFAAFDSTPARGQSSGGEMAVSVDRIGGLALEFVATENLDAGIIDSLPGIVTEVPAGQSLAYNPFKGDVTYNEEAAETATISATFHLALNPGVRPLELAYEPSMLSGYGNGEIIPQPGSATLPPAFPPGVSFTFDQFFDDVANSMGVNPTGETDLGGGVTINVLRPEGLGQGTLTGEPVYLIGARTAAPRTFQCPGVTRDSGIWFDTPQVNWDDSTGANSAAFNDFFIDGDTGLVSNCSNSGTPTVPIIRSFQGPGSNPLFADRPGASAMIVGPHGWIQVVYGGDAPGATAMRIFEFATDDMAPFNPDYTVASAYPLFPGMTSLGDMPHVYYDETLAPTTTTSSTTTTTIAVVAPSSTTLPETTSTSIAAAPLPDGTSSGFPFPLLIFVGLLIAAIGAYLWWSNARSVAPTAAGSALAGAGTAIAVGETVTETAIEEDVATPPAILVDRHGKAVGAIEDSPPLIGLRGWRP